MVRPDLPAIDEATIEMLEGQVKKGKARKFFLIYKGSSIKTLVVFKKGPFGPKIMNAKKSGFKGDVAYGIVIGSGKSLTFQLPGNAEVAEAMKVESWEEKPPAKTARLREFLNTNGLKFKPEFEMVTVVDNALDPDSETDGAEPVDQSRDESLPEQTPSPDNAALLFTQRLKKLKPDMARVISAEISVSESVKSSAGSAADFARRGDFGAGSEVLNEVEELIRQGIKEIETRATGGADVTADQKAKLATAVKKLKPSVAKAIEIDPTRRTELVQSMSGIAADIKTGRLDDAKTKILELGKVVKQLQSPSAAATDAGPSAQFEATRNRLEEEFNAARRTHPGEGNTLLNLWNYAIDQAADESYESAVSTLEKLESKIEQLDRDSSELLASLESWTKARQTAIDQISRLMAAFNSSNHPEANRGVVLLQAIARNLTPRPTVAKQVTELMRYLETDEIISAAESPNPFGFEVSISAPLLKVLSELKQRIN